MLWGSPRGPEVPPGDYQARLTVGDWTMTVPVPVVADPRLDVPQAAHEARFALAKQSWQALTRGHDVIRTARSVRDQVASIAELSADEQVKDAAGQLEERLTDLEEQVLQTKSQAPQDILNFTPMLDNQFLYLQSVVESAPGEPTVASGQRFAELEAELEAIEGELARVLSEGLEDFQDIAFGSSFDCNGNMIPDDCEGDPIVVLEAMKMAIDLPAPKSGTVKSLGFKAGDRVNRDDVLAVIG